MSKCLICDNCTPCYDVDKGDFYEIGYWCCAENDAIASHEEIIAEITVSKDGFIKKIRHFKDSTNCMAFDDGGVFA